MYCCDALSPPTGQLLGIQQKYKSDFIVETVLNGLVVFHCTDILSILVDIMFINQ